MSIRFDPIAIIGRGCILPGANNPAALWEVVRRQIVTVRRATAEDWRIDPDEIIKARPGEIHKDASWSGVGGYLPKIEPFSHEKIGTLDPALDTIFHLLAHTVHQALKKSDRTAPTATPRTGLIMGNLGYPVNGLTDFAAATLLETDWFSAEQAEMRLHPANRFFSSLPLHYVAKRFGLDGPCFALDAACASALYAIKLACDQLQNRQADRMLAGGINASDFLCLHPGFTALNALSRTGQSRPFSQEADGLIPAHGAALVLLKRLDDAVRDKDRILGVIRSVGLSNDGRAGSFLTPSASGQLRALKQAYTLAGIEPEQVSYIECHATGTPVGDPVEIQALESLYQESRQPLLGALKANIGHSITASGTAGLLKVLGMMEHNCLPGTPNVQPLHKIFTETSFTVPEENQTWSGNKLAGISSFGFGGNNAHLLVEEWNPDSAGRSFSPPSSPEPMEKQVVALVGMEVKTHYSTNYAAFQQQLKQSADKVQQEPVIEQIHLGKKELLFPPADLQGALGQQLLLLAAAVQATANLSLVPKETGIFIGMQPDAQAARYYVRTRLPALLQSAGLQLDHDQLEQAQDAVSSPCLSAEVIGTMANITANRLNHLLAAQGTGYAVFDEELSGDTALDIALQALTKGEISTAIVGAVDFCRETTHQAAAQKILKNALTPGDGVVVLVLKTLAQAKKDQDRVLAELCRQDTKKTSDCKDLSERCARTVQERFGHAHCAQGLLHLAAAIAFGQTETGQAGTSQAGTAEKICLTNRSFTGRKYTWNIRVFSQTQAVTHSLPAGPLMPFSLRRPPVDRAALVRLIHTESEQKNTLSPQPAKQKMLLPPPPWEEVLYGSPAPVSSSLPGTLLPPAQDLLEQLSQAHTAYLQQQEQTQLAFLRLSEQIRGQLSVLMPEPSKISQKKLSLQERMTAELRRPKPARSALWEWPEMLKLARGKISEVFGPEFQDQDKYDVQVRLPEPPLLLCERILAIDAVPKSMAKGTIWTEHTVTAEQWYLHHGQMPAGIFIECGQADLTLISYLGIDFLNQGERFYRLLGCEITWFGQAPKIGDTLKYEIRITGHAQQGEVRLFFFEYECWINGKIRTRMRNGHAGFFTRQELNESKGVIWEPSLDCFTPNPRLVAGPCITEKRAFSCEETKALTRGELWNCFGERFAFAKTHHRTPTTEAGRLNFIHQVTQFDPHGGPMKRGYLQAVQAVSPEGCFLDGHFLNDPCMPGTLMTNGCQQMLAFFLTALGFTLKRDGWRFMPKQEHTITYLCQGEVNPQSKKLVYEVFVDELVEEKGIITIYAHVLCTVDGLKALLAERTAVSLIPGWPGDTWSDNQWKTDDSRPVARINGFPLDYTSLMHCALGQPTKAFGSAFHRYNGPVPPAHLPNPPYHYMTRITRLDAQPGTTVIDSSLEALYDIPQDAWYFGGDADAALPFCVLTEIALQPCGWLATANLDAEERPVPHLLFRNLDGQGTLHRTVTTEDRCIRTVTRLTSFARMGRTIIVKFKVCCFSKEEEVFTLDTTFGFFPPSAFQDQPGLESEKEELALLHAPANFDLDLRAFPVRYCGQGAKLPASKLLMLDQITGYRPKGGKAGLGQWRAEKDVDPGDWYFKAHFYSDPVQPGSLGVEGILQLIQLHMLHAGMAEGLSNPRFEPCLPDRSTEWHYRGQVVPDDDKVVFDIEILEQGRTDTGCYVEAEGRLWVNGKKIYQVPRIGMRLTGEPAAVTHRSGLEKVLDVPPLRLGDFTLNVATERRHLQEYIALCKAVNVKEFQKHSYPVPEFEELRGTIVLAAFHNSKVVGGLRIYPPSSSPFVCFSIVPPGHPLPDWRTLRRFGRIGEASSLILHPEQRGEINFMHVWSYVKQILKASGCDYVLVNGSIKSKAYKLYAVLHFKPIALPFIANFLSKSEDQTPTNLPMIAKLREELPWPSCTLDIDLAGIDKFVNMAEKSFTGTPLPEKSSSPEPEPHRDAE